MNFPSLNCAILLRVVHLHPYDESNRSSGRCREKINSQEAVYSMGKGMGNLATTAVIYHDHLCVEISQATVIW